MKKIRIAIDTMGSVKIIKTKTQNMKRKWSSKKTGEIDYAILNDMDYNKASKRNNKKERE